MSLSRFLKERRGPQRWYAQFTASFLVSLMVTGPLNEAVASPHTGDAKVVRVGVFIASLFDLDFDERTFDVVFWVWWIHDDPNYELTKSIEIINARTYEVKESYSHPRSDGRTYSAAKLVATINQQWDTAAFPFDQQTPTIILESVGRDVNKLRFDIDQANTVIGPEVILPGWRIDPLRSKASVFKYNTTFGEEIDGNLAFSRVSFEIPLVRNNTGLFIDAYIGFFLAFLICAALGFVQIAQLDNRLSMIMSGVFSAIGNKYVIENNYPSPARFSLADAIEFSTFSLLLLSLFLAIGTYRLKTNGHDRASRIVNSSGFVIVITMYLVVLVIMIF